MKQIHSRIINLADWFNTDPGQRVIQWESSKFDQIVADSFGFNAVQVGLPDWNFLHHNRMRTKIILAHDSFNNCTHYPNTRFVHTQLDALPL
ncbi:MAG TPA: SAM-dependent methyltransferase, partial [Advenella sp.]|nr:SAM-dependent methyltransferase [Advenella sp.]